jgi:hypothetical protein
MNKKKYEIKIGFHWKNEAYPIHIFDNIIGWCPHNIDSKVIMRSNDELHTHLEHRWSLTPNRDKLMYFYIQPYTTGLPIS